MFRDMDKWYEIRRRVLVEGVSIRQIQRETGLHFTTVKKILENSSPPAFQTPERECTKLAPFKERIAEIIQLDKKIKKKQRQSD